VPHRACALVQRAEERAQPRQLAVGVDQARAEGADLVADVPAALARDLADAPLQPPALGFERERLRIALREGVV
jgi:hypothetical protein